MPRQGQGRGTTPERHQRDREDCHDPAGWVPAAGVRGGYSGIMPFAPACPRFNDPHLTGGFLMDDGQTGRETQKKRQWRAVHWRPRFLRAVFSRTRPFFAAIHCSGRRQCGFLSERWWKSSVPVRPCVHAGFVTLSHDLRERPRRVTRSYGVRPPRQPGVARAGSPGAVCPPTPPGPAPETVAPIYRQSGG